MIKLKRSLILGVNMYNNKKISVAMASYNGEKFIEQQIQSICSQTIIPDELIISDDGSNDQTIQIIKEMSAKYANSGIIFKLLQDNPRHGYCGNFEWAIMHTSGDYIFICDQDDVWYPDKVATVMRFFCLHPEAECVFHEAELINEDGGKIFGTFNYWTNENLLGKDSREGFKINRDQYLESTISQTLAPGMSVCISKELLKTALPFPKCDGLHDQWIEFCAVLDDKCWYIPDLLEGYRLHGDNTSGNKVYRGTKLQQLKKKINRFKATGIRNVLIFPLMAKRMIDLLEKRGLHSTDSYRLAQRIYDIGQKELFAITSNRISGAYRLYKMYRTDIRYKSIGRTAFLYQEYLTIVYSKRKRKRLISQENFE